MTLGLNCQSHVQVEDYLAKESGLDGRFYFPFPTFPCFPNFPTMHVWLSGNREFGIKGDRACPAGVWVQPLLRNLLPLSPMPT